MTIQAVESGRVPQVTKTWRVRMAMEQAGMSQKDLAKALAVADTTVNRWIKGKIAPSRTSTMAIALATGVPYTWLETGKAPADESEPGIRYTIGDSNPEPTVSGNPVPDELAQRRLARRQARQGLRRAA